MTDSDCSMSSATVSSAAMNPSETVVKELSPIMDNLSSDVSITDSEQSENTLTSLTPDPDIVLSQTEEKVEMRSGSEESDHVQLESASSCTCHSDTSNRSPQKRRKINDFQGPDWYQNKCFDRYWKHYKQAMAWCQKHIRVVREINQNQRYAHYSSMFGFPYGYGRGRGVGKGRGRGGVRGRGRERGRGVARGNSGMRRSTKGAGVQKRSKENVQVKTEEEETEESLEMEITEDMIRFFEQSEKHRKERDASKDVDDMGVEVKRVNIETANKKVPTFEAPKERPGLRRTEEMIQLYGKGAAMIHGMETALQMTYDRIVDLKQPKLWPNMPLKLVFN